MATIQTPSRIVGTPVNGVYPNILDNDDMDVTIGPDPETSGANGKQLDIIASNVNKTIQELNVIYKDIGYPQSEISSKKSEIFKVIEETIHRFTSNLKREKVSIQNECDWLRQQIKLILGMLNDKEGLKTLSEMNRGIVFDDMDLYEKGFTTELQKKLSILKSKRENFYEDSPFNVTNNTSNIMEEISFEKKYEDMLENIPRLSLLRSKRELNVVFLDVLKVFVKAFKKLNQCNLVFLDLVEIIGNSKKTSVINFDLLSRLSGREEAEYQKELIDQFDTTVRHLRLTESRSTSFSNFIDDSNDDVTFVVSSPRKPKAADTTLVPVPSHRDKLSADHLMGYLRDINYKLIKSIRNLKVSKVNGELITEINKQINYCEVEVEDRKKVMSSAINQIFELVETLGYNEEQLISIQKQFNEREKDKDKDKDSSVDSANDTYFDLETLKFIQFNPTQFGLNDNHILFIENFKNLLAKVKDTKQKKMDYYLTNCASLWQKLGEDEDYVASFVSKYSDLTDVSLNHFKHEFSRLLARRSEFIDNFIMDTRQEIERYWDMLFYTEDQKAQFKYHTYELDPNESYDKEIILNEHEQELEALKQQYESKAQTLQMYEELQQLLKDQEFLVESSKDSTRLLSKNSCKILLNEERIRKKILKNMPRLFDGLKTSISAYNKTHESPMLIFGQDFYQKVISIERDQKNRGNYRGKKVEAPKPPTTTAKQTSRISPNKIPSRQPQRVSQRPSQRTSPIRTVTSAASRRVSPVSYTNQVRKPAVKLVRNPNSINMGARAGRLANAINSSIQDQTQMSQSSQNSSQISPYMDKRSYNNSSILKSFGTHLQPLNSPLIADSSNSKKSSPSLSRMSPLRINTFTRFPTTANAQKDEDKENQHMSKRVGEPQEPIVKRGEEEMTLNITPIRKDMTRYTSTPASARQLADSSSNLGEEYLNWRSEKLGQMNAN